MEKVAINKIVPDKDNPRKIFPPDRQASLMKSIEKHGILNPIIVEKAKEGKYLIQDGERRYRAAAALGLKEIPVIVDSSRTEIDRAVHRFHLQEQHENWTAAEKSRIISEMAEENNMDLEEIASHFGIPKRSASRYLSYGRLIDKETFKDVSPEWAEAINSLRNESKRIYAREFEKELPKQMEKGIEAAAFNRIADGTITTRRDITKLKDSFTKDPKTIEEFISKKTSPEILFTRTKADGAYHLRNVKSSARQTITHILAFMGIGDVKVDKETLIKVRQCEDNIKKFLDKFDPER